MTRSREELDRMHKEKCLELKKIRAKMAEDLGIDLKQSVCMYTGYCSGTCPKCKSEEMRLNAAIWKKQMEESNLKGRIAAVGLTAAAALSLTGCEMLDNFVALDGDVEVRELDGDVAVSEETEGMEEESDE